MLGRDAAPLFQSYAESSALAQADTEALGDEIAAAIAAIEKERAEVARLLAAAYLPELTEAALSLAERRTGFRALTTRRPLDAMAREAKKLEHRVRQLEADERWSRRDGLVGPHGKLTRDLAEARDMLDPWEKDCRRFEDLDGFLELVEIGYDTPAFEERWWQPQYWRHWAAGDRICEALGLADFGDDVLPASHASREPREKWRAEVARVEEAVRLVHEHVKTHDETVWRLQNLPAIYLEECQAQLAHHLTRADVGLLATWAGDDRAVLVHLKRLSGLGAKSEMLTEMRTQWVAPQAEAYAAAHGKFMLKYAKYSRPKKGGQQVTMPEGLDAKLAVAEGRRQKARATVRRIVAFDAYDRFDLAQPPETWWLHMHDNRRPSVFTPRLRQWYDRHPDVIVVTDPNWEDTRGQPLLAREVLASTGDIS